jgi:hypothetical protein
LDEGNASGKFEFFGKLTEKDSIVLTDFTSNASDESLGTRLHFCGFPTYRELATGWENRELESSNFRQSPEAVLIDFQ